MSRTLAERIKDWRWWGEQALHLILGGALAYAFDKEMGSVGAGLFSSSLGLLRELLQNLRFDTWLGRWYWDGSKGDSACDWAAWTLGAILAAAVA